MAADLLHPRPSANEIIARIGEAEKFFHEAVAAAEFDDARKAITVLGLLWSAFSQRMGETRSPESFTGPYAKRLLS